MSISNRIWHVGQGTSLFMHALLLLILASMSVYVRGPHALAVWASEHTLLKVCCDFILVRFGSHKGDALDCISPVVL